MNVYEIVGGLFEDPTGWPFGLHVMPNSFDLMPAEADAEEILNSGLKLNAKDRAAIAASLIDSLEPGYDEDCEQAWVGEVGKRVRELESGEVKLVPWRRVRNAIRQQSDDTAGD